MSEALEANGDITKLREEANAIEVDPMVKLCEFAKLTQYEHIPSYVVDSTKQHILDQFAVTIGGSGSEGIAQIVDFVKEQGGKEEMKIPFYGGKAPATMVAFAIGAMGRALDLGDLHNIACHISEYCLPSLMAATGIRGKVTGKEFLTASIVAFELLVRIGTAANMAYVCGRYKNHGGFFIFGPTIGVAKLLDLDMKQMQDAMGIARVLVPGNDWEMYDEGTLAVRTHHSFIAENAIQACLLAKRGITGPHAALAGEMGFLHQFCFGQENPAVLTKELGVNWMCVETGFKPFASCRGTHTSVTATLDLIADNNIKSENIKGIQVNICPEAYHWVGLPERWHPVGMVDCQFSLPYAVATAALKGKVFLDDYTEAERSRADVRELMSKITASLDKELPTWAAKVTLMLKDGTQYSQQCDYAKGAPENPLTRDELIEKFKLCASFSYLPLSDELVNKLINKLEHLENVEDVGEEILALITPNIGKLQSIATGCNASVTG